MSEKNMLCPLQVKMLKKNLEALYILYETI